MTDFGVGFDHSGPVWTLISAVSSIETHKGWYVSRWDTYASNHAARRPTCGGRAALAPVGGSYGAKRRGDLR
jgi:hypothetical protein